MQRRCLKGWIDFVDGRNVFPKLQIQLKKYYNCWEKNSRIQAAMDQTKEQMNDVRTFIAEQVPITPPLGEIVVDVAEEPDEGFEPSDGINDDEEEVQPCVLEQKQGQDRQQAPMAGQQALCLQQRYMEQVALMTAAAEAARFRAYESSIATSNISHDNASTPTAFSKTIKRHS